MFVHAGFPKNKLWAALVPLGLLVIGLAIIAALVNLVLKQAQAAKASSTTSNNAAAKKRIHPTITSKEAKSTKSQFSGISSDNGGASLSSKSTVTTGEPAKKSPRKTDSPSSIRKRN